MKKYIAFVLLALSIVSMTGCRHHHRPDHDGPDYRRSGDRNDSHGNPQGNNQRSGNYGGQRNDNRGPGSR